MPNRIHLPELRVPGRRLGRHIPTDPRSRRYMVAAEAAAVSVVWERRVPIFDQGDVGSCTGNACAGALGSMPVQPTLPQLVEDETLAVSIYSDAEKIDGGAGYPPEDDGSTGDSVAQVAKTRGYVSGYLHADTIPAAHAALQAGPLLIGTYWLSGMDSPNSDGVVTVSGYVRGGHEYLCREYDAARDLWWLDNSWSADWGKAGRFAYDTPSLQKLLDDQGDVVSLVPNTLPAPIPAPVSTTVTFAAADYASMVQWVGAPHRWSYATAAGKAWKAAVGS